MGENMIKSTKTRYSDEFYFYENDNVIGDSLNRYGEYTQIEVDLLLSILNDTCVVWDIGANIGYHTVAFASTAKHVYAFEPNRKNFDLLLKNTKDCANVTVVNAAVANKNCFVLIGDFDPAIPDNYGNIKVNEGSQVSICIKLDSFAIDKPDFIKIDVEGFEYAVLDGCREIIEKTKPVLYYEAHETPDLPAIYTMLDQLGYYMYWTLIPNYNHDNFKKNKIDVDIKYVNSYLIGVIASPHEIKNFASNRVLNPDDTYLKFFERKDA